MFFERLAKITIALLLAILTATMPAERQDKKKELKRETIPATTSKTIQTKKDYIYFKELNYWEYIENLAGKNREQMQAAIGKKDTGGYRYHQGKCYIMDHNYQGFDIIGQARPGYIAAVQINGQIKNYKCRGTTTGYNTGILEEMRTDSGTLVCTMPYDLILYTCRDYSDQHYIILSFWEGFE